MTEELKRRNGTKAITESGQEVVNEKGTTKHPLEYKIEPLQLEEHLQKQIEADKHYWLQNDAKLRAVHQGALTYEDFRQIVASAHLKPLSKEDKAVWQNTPSRVLWNPVSVKKECENENQSKATPTLALTEGTSILCQKEIPKSIADSLIAWKYLKTDAEKYDYLKRLLQPQLDVDRENTKNNESSICFMEKCFQEEVPNQIFPDIINILLLLTTKKIDDGKDGWINSIRILDIISRSKRFQLTMDFLSKQDRNLLRLIFQNLNNFMNMAKGNYEESDSNAQEKVFNLLQEVNNKYNFNPNPK